MKILGLFILTILSTTLSVDWYICQIKKECSVVENPVVQKAQAAVPNVAAQVAVADPVEIIKGRIHFKVGAKKFLSSKKVQNHLKSVVAAWKKDPNKTITVSGHTDSKGSRKANYRLSYKRGDVIKKALIHYGVNSKKIKIKSYGEAKPIGSNRTRKGRFLNRRVEIKIN